MVMGIVGVVVSPQPAQSWLRFGLFSLGLAAYLATIRLVRSPRRFWLALTGLALVGLAVAVGGLVGTHWTTYRFAPLAAIVAPLPRVPDDVLTTVGAPDRLHPNQLGGALILNLPALVGTLLFAVTPRASLAAPPRPFAVLAPLVILIVAGYLGLSLARGALLALCVGLLWLVSRRSITLALGLGLAGGAALVGLLAILSPFTLRMVLFSDMLEPQWFPIPTRFEIWSQAVRMLGESPWTGIGLGTFHATFHERVQVVPFYNSVIAPHAHNLYLQAALDLGLPGAIGYVVLLFGAIRTAAGAGRAIARGPLAGAAYGLAAGLIAFSLYGLFDTITVTSRAAAIVWFVIGLAAATGRLAAPGASSREALGAEPITM